MGIAVVRESPLKKDDDLAYLSVSDFEEREIYYGYYKSQPQNEHLQSFIEFLRFNISG